jgi:hypothetical protein
LGVEHRQRAGTWIDAHQYVRVTVCTDKELITITGREVPAQCTCVEILREQMDSGFDRYVQLSDRNSSNKAPRTAKSLQRGCRG